MQHWVLRDREPLQRWSKGRVTLVGDAAHPTRSYAAYGAGMATEDGYFLGRSLSGIDLSDYPGHDRRPPTCARCHLISEDIAPPSPACRRR
ncbi:hypothetical protein MCAG_05069 [Micromonospora sp. ATCC 39149]|uniref:FAD-dependent monooxygenase n=1 Tax=Micromonospora sp. (strain ATCC 39149 / NRRL 15099 / SCC 1413) TaxID=219305 RepID=UPI0001A5077F|nr:FAD-dependent monooxygenase [Micromonospora sp. ATCC 39149]EEP74742.1 hypothetical protein MCAG_05069 [Micromonospora sp. ATCC 39149]